MPDDLRDTLRRQRAPRFPRQPGKYQAELQAGEPVPGQPATTEGPKGQTFNYKGQELEVIGVNADGSFKVRDPKTGRTGTFRK